MKMKMYLVLKQHLSEYPEPITFLKGAPLVVGEKYEGAEGWNDWFFCETPGQKGGWVPAQVIERRDDGSACAGEDYTARELNVDAGCRVAGSRVLNGWVWCEVIGASETGWVPLDNLQEMSRDDRMP